MGEEQDEQWRQESAVRFECCVALTSWTLSACLVPGGRQAQSNDPQVCVSVSACLR